MSTEANVAVETLGAFIDQRFAPWSSEQGAHEAAARLKVDFADCLAEPLATLSPWRIECWRRDRLDSLAQPLVVSGQLQALDQCLSKAVEWRLIDRNPLKEVSLEADDSCTVELFSGGLCQSYLREGWAPVSVNWTWTLGKRAVVELPRMSGETDYVLKIHITGTHKGSPQRLFVDVNDTPVGIVLCRGPASFEFFVGASVLKSAERTELVLRVPDARRPVDHEDSKDHRFLAFRVAKIELRPMAKVQQDKQLILTAEDDLPSVLTQRAALQEMASLGFNCSFGFVQRYVGAEPMSLFRWSAVPIEKLITGLEKRFAGLTARDALDVKLNPDGEFVVEDKVYGFRHHTFVFNFRGGVLERVQRNEYVRVGMLCKTLLEELRERKKLFVYHDAGESKIEDIRRLVKALQVYGANTLLWIVAAPTEGQIGETRQIEKGLIQGYVSGFQEGPVFAGSRHMPSWIKVACRAHQIWSSARESQAQVRLEKQLQSAPKAVGTAPNTAPSPSA